MVCIQYIVFFDATLEASIFGSPQRSGKFEIGVWDEPPPLGWQL